MFVAGRRLARVAPSDSSSVVVLEELAAAGFEPDYLEIREASDLRLPGPDSNDLVVLAAAYLGKARLIDNIRLNRS